MVCETECPTAVAAIAPRAPALRLLESLAGLLRALAEPDCTEDETGGDPLSHPAIRAMSARELADLPFETAWEKHSGASGAGSRGRR